MDRRAFIKLTAVSGTSAALTACGSPDNELIRFVPEEDIYPGVAIWKAAVCPACAAGCGLTVRVMDADADVVRDGQAGVVRIYAAKKLEGVDGHPVNHGGLCARGQAAIQITYHPDRITQPLRRSGERGSGQYEAVSWDDALAELVSRLDALEAAGRQSALTLLTRARTGHRAALTARFLGAFGAPGAVVHDPLGEDVLRRANALSFGRDQMPTFDLANARLVLGFGADFLGTWNSPVSQALGYGEMRQGRLGIRGVFVQVESRMSQTGANADRWLPARPGTEGVLALGIAHVLMAEGLRTADAAGGAGTRIAGWSTGLADYAPGRVAETTGVPAARVEALARDVAALAPAVAIVGGAPLAHTNGLFTALAVNALNALVGSVGTPGGVFFTPRLDLAAASGGLAGVPAPGPSIERLARDVLEGGAAPDVVLIDGANAVYAAPAAWRVREARAAVPYVVSFGSFLDETAALADLILPDHSFLESWSEAVPESGSLDAVAGAALPVMLPLYDTRATPDVLLEVGRRLARPLDLPWQTFDALLAETFGALPQTGDFDAWSTAQETGYWTGPLSDALVVQASIPAADPVRFTEPQFDGDEAEFPFHFQPYASSTFLDGSLAHLPWLQEMPDPLTSAMWSSWVEINPATADRLGIGQGDVVEVTSAHGTLRTAAMITPGIAPDLLAMPMGQGHTTFTRYATGRGANPMAIVAPLAEPTTGALAWAATRVRLTRAGGPDGRLILFAGALYEHAEEARR
jgi:anaerobic selenocysteine-containing dehydrogenase